MLILTAVALVAVFVVIIGLPAEKMLEILKYALYMYSALAFVLFLVLGRGADVHL